MLAQWKQGLSEKMKDVSTVEPGCHHSGARMSAQWSQGVITVEPGCQHSGARMSAQWGLGVSPAGCHYSKGSTQRSEGVNTIESGCQHCEATGKHSGVRVSAVVTGARVSVSSSGVGLIFLSVTHQSLALPLTF
jgi:hypothetical protein